MSDRRDHRPPDDSREEPSRTGPGWQAGAASIGDYVLDLGTGRGEWGERALAMMRLGPDARPTLEEHLGLVHPADRSAVADAIERARDPDGAGRHHSEFRFLFPDGEIRWIEATGRASFAAGGRRATHLFGAMVDVTDRRLAEQRAREGDREPAEVALRLSEERQGYLLRLSDAARSLSDPLAIIEAAVRLLGEHLGVDRAYFVEVDEAAGVARVRHNYLRGGSPSLEGEHRVADFGWVIPPMRAGEMLVVPDVGRSDLVPEAERPAMAAVRIAAHVNAPLVKGGLLVGALCVTEPVPRAWTATEVELVRETGERIWAAVERSRSELHRRAAEERLRLALGAARMGTWTWDVASDDHHRDANLNALLGLPAEDTVRTLAEFLGHIHPDDRPGIRAAFDRSLRHGMPLNTEFRAVWPDGSVRWLRDQGDVFGTAGRARLTGACVDVTDLKEAEEALRTSERRLRAVAAGLPNAAVFVVGPDLRYELAEGHALRVAGISSADLEGKAVADAVGAALADVYVPNYRRALAGEELAIEHSAHGRHFATHLAPLFDPDGRPAAALAVSYDITDRVRAEEAVRRVNDGLEARVAERTADLHAEVERRRDLARRLGTAQEDERRRVSRELHDSVGQLLAALPIAFRAVEASGDFPAPAARKLAEAQSLVDAVSREVHSLAVRLRPTALDDLGLDAALDLLVAEWSTRSGVMADFQSAGLGPGRLAPEVETAVYRVVQEALTNVAKHAQAAGVSVVVSRPDGYVTAVVEDDGAGFVPEATPKGRLGLVGMRERVALVGGELQVESRPGAGTAVLVRIPLPRPGGA